jgi:ParB family chromosome partitioning protein
MSNSQANASPATSALNVETVAIASLAIDPGNAGRHSRRNLEAIKASLRRFGQQKPIVVDENGIVRAGNGTLKAAKALGWAQIQVVRSNLAALGLIAYAIADNRTGELAEDHRARAQLPDGLKDLDINPGDLGFDDMDLGKLVTSLGDIADEREAADATDGTVGSDEGKWLVVVTCRDEAEQAEVLKEMQEAGRECRAIVG